MDPKKGFVIMKDDDLASTRRQTLDLLYEPLVHPIGYALVNLLWQLSKINSNSLLQRPLNDLLTYLNVDARVLEIALHRAEGAGLLRTGIEKDTANSFYIFHLIQPRSAREFFKDDLLSVGLLEAIGNHRFAQLSQALIPKPFNFKDSHDVTRNFLEVYTVGNKHLTNLPQLIRRIRSGMRAKKSPTLKGDQQLIDQESKDFDFPLLLRGIKHDSFSNVDQVKKHKHLILTEHVLYGLDEFDMAKYIGQATSVSTNRVDFNKFRILIAEAFQGNDKMPVKTKYKHHQNQSNSNQLRRDKIDLVKVADQYPPVQFLHQLKKQINPNGIVTHQEENVLKDALGYSAFRDNRGVINILVYYSLVSRRQPTLKTKFMQYMITAWNRANVNTPGEALDEIESHRQKNIKRWRNYQSKRVQNRSRYGGRRTIKQKLPKWARSDYHVKLHPTSQKLQREIKQQLNALNHQPNNRKGGHK